MARVIRDPGAPARIGEAAARTIAQHGVRGATVRAIAAAAGVSTGSVTHYFADKDAIVEAALQVTNTSSGRRIARARHGDGTPLERLRAVVEATLPVDAVRRREWQVWIAVWAEAGSGDPLAEGYRVAWRGLRAVLRELLEEARAAGDLPPDTDVEHGAVRLAHMLSGLALSAGVERPARIRELAERFVEDELAMLGGGTRAAR